MPNARKWLILAHRYLGLVLSAVFLLWFVSGVVMIYTGGMPQLTADEHRARILPLNHAHIRLTPSDAIARAAIEPAFRHLTLLTVMGRPAYRFAQDRPVTVFADTGEGLTRVSTDDALTIAAQFMGVASDRLRHIGILTKPDQWTIVIRRQLPLHKIAVSDELQTQLYVSEQLGEVVMRTTRRSRIAAWFGAIPHWLYFTPLRVNDVLWRQVVLWTSSLGTVLVTLGLVLAIVQFAPKQPFEIGRLSSYIPYVGLLRWHYMSGALFGVFALTWVFSGMLSMQPFNWASSEIRDDEIQRALAGGAVDPALFGPIEWHAIVASGGELKEIEFRRIQDEPFYLVWGSDRTPTLLDGRSFHERRTDFSMNSLVARLKKRFPAVPMVSAELLQDYDSYYYSRDRRLPLPVLRVKLGDRQDSWIYIDPKLGEHVLTVSRRGRLERWIYHGFHRLDFSFWYDKRPLWDFGMILLSLGGATLSAIGVIISFRRMARFASRRVVRLEAK